MSRWSNWLRSPSSAFRAEEPDETPLAREDFEHVTSLVQRVRQNEAQLDAAFWKQNAADCRSRLGRVEAGESGPGRSIPRAHAGPAAFLGAGLGALFLLATSRGDSAASAQLLTWWGVGADEQAASPSPLSSTERVDDSGEQEVGGTAPAITTIVENNGARQLPFYAVKESQIVSARIARLSPRSSLDANAEHKVSRRSSTSATSAVFEPATFGRVSDVAESKVQTQPKPLPRGAQDDFAEQVQALKQADQALKAGDTSGARRRLARVFSSPLVPHATALRAVLACQSGDVQTGRRLLGNHVNQSPNSPYLGRVRRACGVKTE
jgi:hypothetical protein